MIFYAVISIVLVLGLTILMSRTVLYSALALLGVLLTVAAIFVIAKAEFLAVSHVIVYVGGILILILFGIIITNQKRSESFSWGRWVVALVLASMVQFLMLKLIWNYNFKLPAAKDFSENLSTTFTNSQNIGVALMTNHLVALEFMALFLLITLIGAVIIGGRKSKLT